MTIALIVDDHPEALYLLRRILEAEGYAVVEAGNGREALECAAKQRFDVVVSDILMPVMDGFSLCRTWKSDAGLRDIPFIFYTATYVDQADEELGMRVGADLFLIKPLEPQVLGAKVRETVLRCGQKAQSSPAPPDEDSAPFLRQYNEVLVHKLEDKLEQLEEANQALRLKDLALASSHNGIVLASPTGEILYANDTMLRLSGKSVADLIGKPVRELLLATTVFSNWLEQGEGAAPVELEIPADGVTSAAVWLRIERHPINDPLSSGAGFMLSCADVTQEVRLRQDLARVQRFEALSVFAAGVAHDFNNLLMAIYSVLEMDRSKKVDVDERRSNLAMAQAAFERARDLIRRLASFARQGPLERRRVEMRQLLDESIALSLSGSDVKCETRYGNAPAIVSVDVGQMSQVFGNLLINARQAMGDRGKIVVELRTPAKLSLAGAPPVPAVQVTITDDGPGIPTEVLPNVFEPYFTTKQEGTGLGLASSRAIVVEHGGQIEVRSTPGVGTSFDIILPAADGQAEVRAQESPSDYASACTARILVMDDQPGIRDLLRRGLERAGYALVTTTCGEEAIGEFASGNKHAGGFDLVLLDIHIQGGMGGEATLAELKRLDPGVLAIAMTGSVSESSTSRLLECGFARVLRKPFLLHELHGTIKAVLARA